MAASSPSIFDRTSAPQDLADLSLKELISWGDHYKVNQPHIDAQHEAIFRIVGEVSALWHERGSSEQLLAIVDKLDKVVRAHFGYEEGVLAEIGYPKLAEHKKEHEIMLRDLESIRDRIARMAGGPAYPEPGWMVMNFLLGLTGGHITHSDVDYCRYVRDSGLADLFGASPS